MATFQYVRKDGSLGSIEAPDQNTALRALPADADPGSGVMGGLSGTGTPAPGSVSLPGSTPLLPDTESSDNPLLNFKNAIAKIDAMARENRSAFAPGLAGALPEGTLNASSFGDIVQMLNRGGDKYASETAANALDTQTPDSSDILTTTNDAGVVTAINKATGEVLWKTPAGTGNQQGESGGGSGVMIKSGNLVYTRAKYAEDSSDLEASRGPDGWVDPSDYKLLYDEWVAKGGLLNDFIAKFPPKLYVNPENDWLPPYLRPAKSGDDSNPFN